MDLLQHINYRVTFDKVLEQELLKFFCFFQNNLWDGYSDEQDPKFITPEDFEAIEALAGKIEHMTLNIGCPNSVEPMLWSIAHRNVKRWSLVHTPYNDFIKGRQLKSRDALGRTRKEYHFEFQKDNTIAKGHFRWNNRGYILSRRCTDLLTEYLSR